MDRGLVVNLFRRVARRLRRTITGDRRLLLVEDVDRCGQYMAMILHTARAMGVPETVDAATALSIWRKWSAEVKDWASESEA
jgi:hydrogenase maturation factor